MWFGSVEISKAPLKEPGTKILSLASMTTVPKLVRDDGSGDDMQLAPVKTRLVASNVATALSGGFERGTQSNSQGLASQHKHKLITFCLHRDTHAAVDPATL